MEAWSEYEKQTRARVNLVQSLARTYASRVDEHGSNQRVHAPLVDEDIMIDDVKEHEGNTSLNDGYVFNIRIDGAIHHETPKFVMAEGDVEMTTFDVSPRIGTI